MARGSIMAGMRSRALLAGAAALAVAGLTACGTPLPVGAGGADRSDPLSLVGSWTVTAADEEPDAKLVIADDLSLTRHCGDFSGRWRASPSGLFVGMLTGWSMSCGTSPSRTKRAPSWLVTAVSYRTDGSDRLLVDRAGSTTARLVPATGPTTTLWSSFRDLMRVPAPTPAGLTPAAQQDLLRRWVPLDGKGNGNAYIQFDADGQYEGSDGCNGEGGRYLLGADGELVAVTRPQTLKGCNNSEAAGWVVTAARAALDGSTLVLLDPDAHELGRLQPATP
jgi:META domain